MSAITTNPQAVLRAKIARMNAAHDAYIQAVKDLDREMQSYTGAVTIERPDVALIIEIVSEFYNTRPTVILSRVRTDEIARARFVSIALVRKFKKLAYAEIGRIFNRDHGAIGWALKAIGQWQQTDAKFCEEFAAIEANVKRRIQAQRQAA